MLFYQLLNFIGRVLLKHTHLKHQNLVIQQLRLNIGFNFSSSDHIDWCGVGF